MADEKKKPDLKSRLNRTQVGAVPPPPAAVGDAPVSAPGIASPAEFVAQAPAATPYVSPGLDLAGPPGLDLGTPAGIPGSMGSADDIAVPEFIQEERRQQAAEQARRQAEAAAAQARAEAAARAAAAAANPFDSVQSGPSAQDIRLVIDEKMVSDEEVGRRRTGTFVGYGAVALVMLGAGYLVGQQMESRAEGQRTIQAVSDIQHQVNTAGATIATMKDKVDHAATAAGIQTEGGDQPAAAPAPATAHVDEDLTSWFAQQSPDPPFSADSYANRVGRLRPDLVTKLMKVQLGIQQAWNDLRRHQETTGRGLALINSSLADAQRARGEFDRMMVVFAHGTGDGPAVMGTLVSIAPGATGAMTIAPPIPGTAPTRTLYDSGDLSLATTIGTVGIPVSSRAGLAASALRGLGQPWTDYVARVRSLKTVVDQLAQDHRSLSEALTQHGG